MTDFQQYFDESHQLIRDSVRRFVEREVLPHIDEWEEAEEFPRELYLKAGAAGIPRHRLPGSLRRQLRRRSVRQGGGQRRAHALRFRRLGRRVGIAGYRLASGGQVGPSRGARAGGAGGAARREDHGPGGHRALWRLRRGQP